jgi:hypothetical protein
VLTRLPLTFLFAAPVVALGALRTPGARVVPTP